MASALSEKHCAPCEGGTQPMDEDRVREHLSLLDSRWAETRDGKAITAGFKFKNYYHTQAFINAVGWIAHREGHHPDIEFGYNRAQISYTTHAIGGLSENDFISAAKVDTLLPEQT